MSLPKITEHPHLASIEAAFPGAPDDVIASWLIDLADDFGPPPNEDWHPHLGNTFGLWKLARWSRQVVSIVSLDQGHRQAILRMVDEYRSGTKVVTRNGRERIDSLVTFLREHGVLPHPPTVAEFMPAPNLTLMDGYHRWVAWAEVRGPEPIECWVARF